MIKNKNKIYAWGCDFESFRGEGILGLNFLKQLSNVSKFEITAESPTKSFKIYKNKINYIKSKKNKNLNFNFFYNYFYPLYGAYKIKKNLKKYDYVCYVNFLPMWNFILLLLLPKNTILGPITGANDIGKVKNINGFIKKFLFPFLYKISSKILRNKKELLFSTSILKKYIKRSKKRQIIKYNYNLINYENKKRTIKSKNIDFLFYYRNYSAHGSNIQKKIINQLADKNYKIIVVGQKIFHPRIKNLGVIKREKVCAYLKKTKFTLNEATNFLSIFALDSMSCAVKIFYNKNSIDKKNIFMNKYFLPLNFDDVENSLFKIENQYKNYKNEQFPNLDIKKIKIFYDAYFKSHFKQNK